MVTLELIESFTTLEEIERYIDLGKGVVEDSKKALTISIGCMVAYNTRIIENWENEFLPALEKKKETILKNTSRKRRRCYGCDHDLCGQREHMGGCLPDYNESWSD